MENQKQKILSSNCTIRFSDCDPFGHLNNARYIDYMINAREEQLSKFYSFNLHDYFLKGYGWVVASHEIAYLKPAKLNETVVIQSSLIELSDSHVKVEMSILNEERTHLKTIMWSKFVFINLKTGQKEKHQEALIQFFQSVKNEEVNLSSGLHARISQYKEKVNH